MRVGESNASYKLDAGGFVYEGKLGYILGVLDVIIRGAPNATPCHIYEVRTTEITERTLRSRQRVAK